MLWAGQSYGMSQQGYKRMLVDGGMLQRAGGKGEGGTQGSSRLWRGLHARAGVSNQPRLCFVSRCPAEHHEAAGAAAAHGRGSACRWGCGSGPRGERQRFGSGAVARLPASIAGIYFWYENFSQSTAAHIILLAPLRTEFAFFLF